MLLQQMATNDVAYIVTRHNIAVHEGLTGPVVKSVDFELSDKLLTCRTLFRSVVFIDTDYNVTLRPT